MASDYDKIRDDNLREYGQGTRHLSFLGRLYTDRTHFVFELLQNAEDAGASHMLFNLFEDRLEVLHNGRPFNERDVRGICGVGEGTKAEDLTQIGKFGIGFKSVYAYSSKPEIFSGDESFRIEHYVRPYGLDARTVEEPWTTRFVFTFDAPGVDPAIAYQEISSRLRQLSGRTLLFLRNILEIEYRLSGSNGGMYIREEIVRGAARQVTVVGQCELGNEDEEWLIFERPISVQDIHSQVHVEVAFRLEVGSKGGGEYISRVKDAPLVVYFPTEKATRFGFLIQGPYRTTPARDNIPRDDQWNTRLVAETAQLLVDALDNLKEMGLLTVSLLESMPIRMEDFPETGMFFPIVEAIREVIKARPLLPTDDGGFVSASNAKLARGTELRRLLDSNQLRLLFGSKESVKWLSSEITQDKTPDLRTYLLDELKVEEVTPESFARKISEPYLIEQPDQWFVAFYGFLSDQKALWRSPVWRGDTGGVLRAKPILRLQDNSVVAPFRSDSATPLAFLPPPEETDFPVVKRSIASDIQAREFLESLGLSEPDVYDDIVERVLPKYSMPGFAPREEEHAADMQKILRAMLSDSESGKGRVSEAAKQSPFIRARTSSGSVSFKRPPDVYFDSEDIREYFAGSSDVWFLEEPHACGSADLVVWEEMGVSHLPRRLLLADGLPSSQWEYSTRGHYIENYDLHGLEHFLDSLNIEPDASVKTKRSLLLWKYLQQHLAINSRFFEARYRWFYYSDRTKIFDALILTRLQGATWIPTKDGTMEQPASLTVGQLLDDFSGDIELCEKLGISKGVDRVGGLDEDEKRAHADRLGVSLEDVEFLKEHREAVERLKVEIAASKAKPTFPTRTVTNPERRKERLTERFVDAPEKTFEPRERSVRTTRGCIDPVVWLRSQYTNDNGEMICQICKDVMPFRKRNGEYYFEAVEAFSQELLGKEHEAQFLALCPLCSAMYREYVKLDNDVMQSLIASLKSAIEPELELRLGDVNTSIRFVETHFSDLVTILEEDE